MSQKVPIILIGLITVVASAKFLNFELNIYNFCVFYQL
ncbi:hypothetical protein AO381_1035 [Moraxella catarrhalis]|nr:hypothetical protein AO381_1035 [Moraxella catarrhalis]